MSQVDVVTDFWAAIAERDWARMATLLAPDAVVEWPATGERILGRENVVAVNAEYPEGWAIQVLRIIEAGDLVISEIEVPHESMGVFRAVSLWTVEGDIITFGREYWIEVGGEEAPAWRAPYTQPL